MTRTVTPLRYPGGKSALHNLVCDILYANELDSGHYVEPFAGGGGLALSLLFEGVIHQVHLNDIDPAIAAFWRSILAHNDEICDMIMSTPVTIDEWHVQRSLYADLLGSDDNLRLGFATLFLNRTNRSGIVKGAGVIGGLRQAGDYLLDCRFNKPDLIKRIKRIAKYRDQVHFTQLDAPTFIRGIEKSLSQRSLIFADPPYYGKGVRLYTSFYKPEDHVALAACMLKFNTHWITTYDSCSEIAEIYKLRRQYEFSIQYSAQTKRRASELLIASKGMRLPADLPLTKVHQPSRQYTCEPTKMAPGYGEIFDE